ncbi:MULTISPECIES: glycerophosphodiester phosphodiesterase family protein [Sphingomonas]|uniref:Glycerophosphodiester phosphodiesterase n=1 Tax=Edaphosphingomonas fennica TaxID=114404 RepID=A0A2T4HPN6_9SPHN|nr:MULTISPECIES: glycerophosphodiester phosphodiesterase family protein [Sphingomonas]PTD17761.1 glycerophosphodiester phosphodiesterase [Sphingomonas fennica]
MRSLPSGLPDALFAPAPAAERIAFLKGRRFAHRGLHGRGRVENSRAAFAAAIAHGDGIELDVQQSADGQAIVFHDATLDRLTGRSGALADLDAAALGRIALAGSDGETLPTLAEILSLIAGRVPLLIEVKSRHRRPARLCAAVRDALAGYSGAVAVMSFNPEVARWFSIHAPAIVRGLVVTEEKDRNLPGRLRRHLALWRARPDFLAYDVRDLPSPFAAAQRRRGIPVLSWTVRTDADEATVAAHADAPIHEHPLG